MHAVSAHEEKRNEILCFYAHHARNGTQPKTERYLCWLVSPNGKHLLRFNLVAFRCSNKKHTLATIALF